MKKINLFLNRKMAYILGGIVLSLMVSSFTTLVIPPPPREKASITLIGNNPGGSYQSSNSSNNIGCITSSDPFLFDIENNTNNNVTNIKLLVTQIVRINQQTVTIPPSAPYVYTLLPGYSTATFNISSSIPSGYMGSIDFIIQIEYTTIDPNSRPANPNEGFDGPGSGSTITYTSTGTYQGIVNCSRDDVPSID